MNKSEVLRALEWVDQTAREGDVLLLEKARLALGDELHSKKNASTPEETLQSSRREFRTRTLVVNRWKTSSRKTDLGYIKPLLRGREGETLNGARRSGADRTKKGG